MINRLKELIVDVADFWGYSFEEDSSSYMYLYYSALNRLDTYCEDNNLAFPLIEIVNKCLEFYADKIDECGYSYESIKEMLKLDLECCGSF